MSDCTNQPITNIVTLTFKRSELIYDVANYSFVEGDIMKADEEHARHQVFDIVESGNENRVTRILNLAHAECIEMLFPYTKEDIVDSIKAIGKDEMIRGERLSTEDFANLTKELMKHK